MFEEAGFLVYVQEVTYEDPSHEWTHTINLYCTCYIETAWLAAIQGTIELFMFLAPLAIGQPAYVMARCPSSVRPCVRPCVRPLTFSLNIFFSETTYRILINFTEMFLPWSSSEFLEII